MHMVVNDGRVPLSRVRVDQAEDEGAFACEWAVGSSSSSAGSVGAVGFWRLVR